MSNKKEKVKARESETEGHSTRGGMKKVKISSLKPGDEFYLDKSKPAPKRVVYEVTDQYGYSITDAGVFYHVEGLPHEIFATPGEKEVWIEAKRVKLETLKPGESFKPCEDAICVWTVCDDLHNCLISENEILACSDYKVATYKGEMKVIPVEKKETSS